MQGLVVVTHGVVAILLLFNGNVDLVEVPC